MKSEEYNKALDELETDLLVSTLFETERPPQGISGLVDWRLNGFLSRMMLKGALKGEQEEATLVPLQRRLPARRFLLLGLGTPQEYTIDRARKLAVRISKTIEQLGAIDVAIHLPPARDETTPGETDLAVYHVLRNSKLPKDLLLRWLRPSVIEQ